MRDYEAEYRKDVVWARPKSAQSDWTLGSREEGKWGWYPLFGQQQVSASCNGKKRCPSQSRTLSPGLEEAGWKTKIQTKNGSSYHHTAMEQESCHSFAPQRFHIACICGRWFDWISFDLSVNSRIPGTNMYPSHTHLRTQSFPRDRCWSPPDTPLLFSRPALGTPLSFFAGDLKTFHSQTNCRSAASKFLRNFLLIGIRMLRHICYQFFWIDLFVAALQELFF